MRYQGAIGIAAAAAMLMVSSALAGEPAGGRSLTDRIADELTAGGNSNISEMIAAETGQADLAAVRAEQGVAGPEGIRDEADPPRDDRLEIERRMIERRKEELRQGQRREEARRLEAREAAQREEGPRPEARRLEARPDARREEARRLEARPEVREEAQRDGTRRIYITAAAIGPEAQARQGAQREIQLLETKLREIQERLTELRRGARGGAQKPEIEKSQPQQRFEPRRPQRGETPNEPPRPGMPGMSAQPMSPGSGQGPMMGRGFGQGPMMGRGFGQGPMMGRGQGQGQCPMMGRGSGQGPMMGRGSGQGPMMGRGFGQGPMMGRGQGQGPMMGRGFGQGPMMGRGFGQGPMMGRGQVQGPMMQGRRPEAMPEGRGQQRREAMPEQGRREGRMTEGPQAKVVTPSLHGQLPGRVARLLEPGVIEKLRLSDEQRDRIHRLMAEYREQITNMSQRVASAVRDIPAGQRVGKAAEIVGNARKHAQSLTRELIDKATDVLTPRQRAAVEKLLDAVDKMGKAPKSREKEDGDDDEKDDDDR